MGELRADRRAGMAEPTLIQVQFTGSSPNRGLIAALFGCFFGFVSIFIFSVLFVPLSALCSLTGLLRSTRYSTVGVSLLGFLLAAVGFITSPMLLLLTGAIAALASSPAATPKFFSASQPSPRPAIIRTTEQTVLPRRPSFDPSVKRMPELPPPSSAPSAFQPEPTPPQQIKPYMLPARVQLGTHWVEVTREMVACGGADDRPELKRLGFHGIVAYLTKTSFPEGCYLLKIGNRYLVDAGQTAGEQQQILKLWEINCRRGCVPFASPLYVPPWTLVGAFLRPSSRPPNGIQVE